MSSEGQSFGEVVSRLDEIVEAVRSKDASLEHSLDLLDEAIALGSRAVELVDSPNLSPEELARVDEPATASNSEVSTAGADARAAGDAGDASAPATHDDVPMTPAGPGVS